MLHLQSAHYRSVDPIQHLRLKVSLWRVSGPARSVVDDGYSAGERAGRPIEHDVLSSASSPSLSPSSSSAPQPPPLIDDPMLPSVGHEDPIVLEVGWQQKVMSREEVGDVIRSVGGDVNLLKTEAAPPLLNLTPMQRRRREMASAVLRRGESGSALYTYVDSDDFDDGMGVGITTSCGRDRRDTDVDGSAMGHRQHSTMYVVTDIGTKQELLDLDVNVGRVRRQQQQEQEQEEQQELQEGERAALPGQRMAGPQTSASSSSSNWNSAGGDGIVSSIVSFFTGRSAKDVEEERLEEKRIRDKGRRQVLLVSIRAYPNGSIDIRPAFSNKESASTSAPAGGRDAGDGLRQSAQTTPRQSSGAPGAGAGVKLTSDDIIAKTTDAQHVQRYRFEAADGSIFEYTVENAAEDERRRSKTAGMELRAADHVASLRRNYIGNVFEKVPGVGNKAARMVVLGELVSGRGFSRNCLYVDYVIDCGTSGWRSAEGGSTRIQGCTQVSKHVRYPRDPNATEEDESTNVVHWSFPIEVELECDAVLPLQRLDRSPILYLQVCSCDEWDRYHVEGYSTLTLDYTKPGSQTHKLRTWRPAAVDMRAMADYFIGGGRPLPNITWARLPRENHEAVNFMSQNEFSIVSKLGMLSESSGELKLRTNVVVQSRWFLAMKMSQTSEVVASKGHAYKPNQRYSLSAIVERARRRVAQARGVSPSQPLANIIRSYHGEMTTMESIAAAGGGVVGAVSSLAFVRHPESSTVGVGDRLVLTATAESSVAGADIVYHWTKDDIPMAGQRNATLIIPTVQRDDAGRYACHADILDGGERATSRTARISVRVTASTPRSEKSGRFRGMTPSSTRRRSARYLSENVRTDEAAASSSATTPHQNR